MGMVMHTVLRIAGNMAYSYWTTIVEGLAGYLDCSECIRINKFCCLQVVSEKVATSHNELIRLLLSTSLSVSLGCDQSILHAAHIFNLDLCMHTVTKRT